MKDEFAQQIKFQALLGNDINTQEFKNKMFLGLMEELVEAMKETPSKSHKKIQQYNPEKFLEELVDVQLYLLNLVISSKFTYDEFLQKIQEKQLRNVERIKNGY